MAERLIGSGNDSEAVRVLAVASGGGHWEQLMLLSPVLDKFSTHFATTHPMLAQKPGRRAVSYIPDINRKDKLAVILCFVAIMRLMLKNRPHYVLTTGAMPGLLAIVAGRLCGAQTVWIDSVANSQTLSLSGKWARRFATLWLTQWENLAKDQGPLYRGRLL